MGQVQGWQPEPIWPWMQPVFADWLYGWFYQEPTTGSWGLRGVSAYPSALYPDLSQTLLPSVWGAWQPWDAGTMYLANQLAGGLGVGQYSPLLAQLREYGRTSGPGGGGVAMALQYGAPSQAGQYLSNLAQFGVPSEGGRPLYNYAMGYQTPAFALLAPFLSARPYRAPTWR